MHTYILAIARVSRGKLIRSREIQVAASDSESAAASVTLEPYEYVARIATPESLKANRAERRRAEYFASLNL